MQVYLVGGAVRDNLLGITSFDKDFVVVGSNQQEMLSLGFKQVGKDFPVFLHPKTHEEYALARIEKKVGLGYTGFEFETTNVTLKEDLSRRDLTINSMAVDEHGNLVDYFGGEEDLQMGILRHTSASFSEDPVRVLRIARFAAKFKPYGFKVAHSTFKLLRHMVESGEVDNLVKERVFTEMQKVLGYQHPSAFFKTLATCGAYQVIFEISSNNTTHTNTFEFLDNICAKEEIKFTLWLSVYSLPEITNTCNKLGVPKSYKELATLGNTWSEFVQNFDNKTAQQRVEFFNKTDSVRRIKRFNDLLQFWQLLGTDTTQIEHLNIQIKNIDTSTMDTTKIVEQITQAKIKICNLL